MKRMHAATRELVAVYIHLAWSSFSQSGPNTPPEGAYNGGTCAATIGLCSL